MAEMANPASIKGFAELCDMGLEFSRHKSVVERTEIRDFEGWHDQKGGLGEFRLSGGLDSDAVFLNWLSNA